MQSADVNAGGAGGELRIDSADGVVLSASSAGEGIPIVLLHGLTATRRYVVMGSRALQRSGHRVLAYDARAHGTSDPAPDPEDYGYGRLARDLSNPCLGICCKACGQQRAHNYYCG